MYADQPKAMHRDVLILGPYPPPFGGVSMHIQQLVRSARRRGLRADVANHYHSGRAEEVIFSLWRSPLRYARICARAKATVIHYHHSNWLTLLATAIGARMTRSKLVMTVHAETLICEILSRHWIVSKSAIKSLKSFDIVIAVSEDIRAQLSGYTSAPIIVIPAFAGCADTPQRTWDSDLSTVFVVAAYRVGASEEKDIYGLRLALEALKSLVAEGGSSRLEIFVANRPRVGRERNYLRTLRRIAALGGIESNVTWHFGSRLTDHLNPTRVFIRPTYVDGDSVSVREALAIGCQVIASDAATRPVECRIFHKGDAHDLSLRMRESQDAPILLGSPRPAMSVEDQAFTSEILDVYQTLMDGREVESHNEI
jgi:glycosyltransferase involved in cell wall biosynthesis